MKLLWVFLWVLSTGVFWSQSSPKTRVLLILDASNSMNSAWGNQTRIQAAREILNQELEILRGVQNVEVALRVYGHQTPFNNLNQDCNDTRLEIPFGSNNLEAIKNKIKSIEAKGATPIARSLEASAADFPDTLSRNVIILITDGLESCDNDPCIIAKKLKDKGVKVTPFVIGLGMDMTYLDKFKCIGSYSDAEDKESFRRVFKTILTNVLQRTTVQINLNDVHSIPSETDVTVLLYEAGTNHLKYSFIHTLNRMGNPDTLSIDPSIRYDVVVQTLPMIEKKAVEIKKHVHNVISLDAPQGYLKLTSLARSTFNPLFEMRVIDRATNKTINHQGYQRKSKYLIGKYDVEVLTIPRIYRTVEIKQSTITNVEIEAPGELDFSFVKPIVGQIFQQNASGKWELIYTFSEETLVGKLLIQPGSYKLIYRFKEKKSSGYSNEKLITISSNKTYKLNLN
jgi:Ca-activated chloride channel family protein